MGNFYKHCKAHLNWTLIIVFTVIELSLVIPFILVFQNVNVPLFEIWVIASLLELTLGVWFLYQKKRSFAYLLLIIFLRLFKRFTFNIPVGDLIFLGLNNNRLSPPPKKRNTNLV